MSASMTSAPCADRTYVATYGLGFTGEFVALINATSRLVDLPPQERERQRCCRSSQTEPHRRLEAKA
ncbi:hypothetical protein AOG23_33825 [Rhizobium acidisoli]|nr:hypothetical protein AOG23_33825 [Rhizobium acidisoli]